MSHRCHHGKNHCTLYIYYKVHKSSKKLKSKFVKGRLSSNVKLRQSEYSSEDHSMLASMWSISSILSTIHRLSCIFTAQCGLFCRQVSVRLSVLPSVTLVHCIQMAEDIVKLLSRPSSPSFQYFDPERQYPIPRGTLSLGAQNTREGQIFFRFSTEIAVYLRNGTIQASGCYGTLIGNRRLPLTRISMSRYSSTSNISETTMCKYIKKTL